MKAFTLTPDMKRRMTSFADGEISIMLGDDAAANLHASLHLANTLRSSRRFEHIIYLNLPFSRNRFTEAQNMVQGRTGRAARGSETDMKVYHLTRGRAVESLSKLEEMIADPKRTAIIINSWELTSSSYRLREMLIFALHALQIELGVTVIVFAMSDPRRVSARKVNRSGLGKLAMMTDSVVSLIEDEPVDANSEDDGKEAEETTPEILMLPAATFAKNNDEGKEEAEEENGVGVNLPISKNNNLPDAGRHLNRRERRKLERLATIGRV